jgi:hypothetical protein
MNNIKKIDNVGTDIDYGVCSWPWQWFALGKGGRPLFVTSNPCIPFKKYIGLKCGRGFCVSNNAVPFCSMLRLELCTNLTSGLLYTKKITWYSDRDVFDRVYMFSSERCCKC